MSRFLSLSIFSLKSTLWLSWKFQVFYFQHSEGLLLLQKIRQHQSSARCAPQGKEWIITRAVIIACTPGTHCTLRQCPGLYVGSVPGVLSLFLLAKRLQVLLPLSTTHLQITARSPYFSCFSFWNLKVGRKVLKELARWYRCLPSLRGEWELKERWLLWTRSSWHVHVKSWKTA